jgi:hypothetical protein
MTQLSSNIYENGEWPNDFTEVPVIKKRSQKGTKCNDHCTDVQFAHSARAVMRILFFLFK